MMASNQDDEVRDLLGSPVNNGDGVRSYGSTSNDDASSVRPSHSAAPLIPDTEAVSLSWESLNVTLQKKRTLFNSKSGEPKNILKGVSGIVNSGTLMAIMGSSGSGKTTLLNVLTNRNIDEFNISGSVKVNGQSLGSKIANISAYVQQEDLFVGILTVKEHLWFQAMLRMDQDVSAKERDRRINEVMRDLGLQKCENSIIGVPGKIKSISGGERKRLSFASEVLTNPRIMFCDEPTSGLDSYMAESVVQNLRTLAGQGKAILCTIHQPSSETFALFDNLLLLAEGRLIYMGTSSGAKDFFRDAGYPCPTAYNPADFYMKTLAVVPDHPKECRIRIKKISAAFRTSDSGKQLIAKINEATETRLTDINDDQVTLPQVSTSAVSKVTDRPLIKSNIFKQFRCLTWRASVANYRDIMYLRVRLLQNVLIALFTGLVFFAQNNDQKGVQNINGCLFLICTNMTFSNSFGVILTFTAEMPLFKREHQNGTYRTSMYFLCKMLADVPLFIINPIIFTSIAYWMVGMKYDLITFLICCGTTVLFTATVVSWGYMISAACGEAHLATVLAGPLTTPFILFGGFLLNDASIPVYFIWLEYLSWFKYANEIFIVNQWHNFGPIGCEFDNHFPPFNSTAIGVNNGTLPSSRCFRDGEQVVASFNYHESNLPRNFIMLAALAVGFRLLGYVFLYLRANPIKLRRSSPHDPIVTRI